MKNIPGQMFTPSWRPARGAGGMRCGSSLDWCILQNRPDRLQAEKGQEEEEFEDDEVKGEVVRTVPPNSVIVTASKTDIKQFSSHAAQNRRRIKTPSY